MKRYSFHIKDRSDIIFIHIPKTGGTSVRRGLPFYRPKETNTHKHYTVRQIIEEIGEDAWQKSYKFAIVRDPWSRMVSFYNYRVRRNKLTDEGMDLSFKEWVIKKLNRTKNSDAQRGLFSYSPQYDWLVNSKGDIDLDFIGRYETLEIDFKKVCEELKISGELPVINAHPDKVDYHEYYDDELVEIISDFYKDDVAHFNYKF